MALAETAKFIVDLSLKGNFTRAIGQASKSLDKFDTKLDHAQGRAYVAGQQIGTGIKRGFALGAAAAVTGVGAIAFEVNKGLDSLIELEKMTTQTNAVIKSTGGVAGVTAGEVRKLAEEFESMNATVGDEVIQNAENLLLTFTNIRKRAFKPTLQAALDMNTALGGGPDGLATNLRLLGRALDNPEKGLTLLERRTGKFTDAEKKAIAQHLKNNDLLGAQTIILDKLNKKYGGSFLAQGGTTAGKVGKFRDAIEDLQRTLAVGFLPVVSNIADALSELFADPAVQQGVKDFGQNLADLFTPARIKEGIGTLKDIFSTIASVAGPAASAVGLLVSAFNKIPPDLRNILIGAFAVNKLTNGLFTNIAGGIGQAFKNMVTASMNVEAGVVNVAGGVGGGVPGAGGKGGGGVGGLIKSGLALTVAGAIVAVAPEIGKAFADWLPPSLKGPGGKGESEAQRRITEARAKQPTTVVISPSALQHIHEEHVRHGQGAIDKSLKASLAAALIQAHRDAARQVTSQEVHGRGEHSRAEPPGPSTQVINDLHHLASKLGATSDLSTVIPNSIRELQNDTTVSLDAMKAQIIAGNQTGDVSKLFPPLDGTKTAIDNTKTQVSTSGSAIQNTTRSSMTSAKDVISGSVNSASSAIVTAIYAARPIVNVTNVTRSTTIQERYAPGNGSSGQNAPKHDII